MSSGTILVFYVKYPFSNILNELTVCSMMQVIQVYETRIRSKSKNKNIEILCHTIEVSVELLRKPHSAQIAPIVSKHNNFTIHPSLFVRRAKRRQCAKR